MQTFLQDLKYALRMLKKNPAFTSVAILTLALGIGANSAIFSVLNSVLLRPLPYRQPGQLVRVYSEFPTMQLQKFWLSPPEFLDIQHEAKSWEAIGAWVPSGQNVGTESEPLRVTAAAITRGLIEVLGVQPERGRNFTEEEDRNGGPNVAIISQNDSTPLESSIRTAVRELDPNLPVYNLWSMNELVSKSMVQPRFLALLLATFSGIALFLAAIGIYGVMAYSVAQRTQEIGVRMALGARPLHVLRLVIGQSLSMLLIGTVIGLAGAFALTRLMRTLLFEITATDPLTYVSVIGLLTIVALLACYIPARRAAKVDPLIALRYE